MHICKAEHSEQIRSLCLEQWASSLGQEVWHGLSRLYLFLSWEKVALKTSLLQAEELDQFTGDSALCTQLKVLKQFFYINESSKSSSQTQTQPIAYVGSPMEVDSEIINNIGESSSGSSSSMDTSNSVPTAAIGGTFSSQTIQSLTNKVSDAILIEKQLEPLLLSATVMHRSVEDLLASYLLKLAINQSNQYSRRLHLARSSHLQSQVPTPNARALANQLASIPNIVTKFSQVNSSEFPIVFK